MMVASFCSTSCGTPLFLHVLGAMLLFGTLSTVLLLAVVGSRRPQPAFDRATFVVVLAGTLPAWLLMRAGGQWLVSKEHLEHLDATWINLGFDVGDGGLILLLVTTGLAYLATRRPGGRWPLRAVALLSALYLVAIVVTWFGMAAKWG
jgi:hypothetical protein